MGMTPYEERQIHQIEESLLHSDPGLAERMERLLRPRRRLMLVAAILLAFVLMVAIGRPGGAAVTLSCVGAGALAAGWCLGRIGRPAPGVWLRWLRVRVAGGAHALSRCGRCLLWWRH